MKRDVSYGEKVLMALAILLLTVIAIFLSVFYIPAWHEAGKVSIRVDDVRVHDDSDMVDRYEARWINTPEMFEDPAFMAELFADKDQLVCIEATVTIVNDGLGDWTICQGTVDNAEVYFDLDDMIGATGKVPERLSWERRMLFLMPRSVLLEHSEFTVNLGMEGKLFIRFNLPVRIRVCF